MTVKDLMIGDFVLTPIGKIAKVSEISSIDNEIGVFFTTPADEDVFDITEIKPIPLTREILKKNDFEGDRIMEYRFEEDGETYNLYLKEMYNRDGEQDSWGTSIGGVLPSVVMYVHELQHILRLAGLKEKADNFKIK